MNGLNERKRYHHRYLFGFAILWTAAIVLALMQSLWNGTGDNALLLWLGHGVFWILGMTVIFWSARKLSANMSLFAESESKYRMLFDKSTDAVFVHAFSSDVAGPFLEVNDVACRHLGYSKDELKQLTPADIDDPSSRDNIPKITKKLELNGTVLFEAMHVAKDGTRIPVEINAHLFDLNGVPTVLSIARDITERRRSEEQLQAERSKLKSILHTMPDGVYIVNRQYDIEYVNPVIERDFGAAHGRKCYSYFHDRNEVCSWCKNDLVFAGQSVHWEFHADKTGKTYDLFDTAIKNNDGTLSKLEIFHDITARVRAEEEQKNLHLQLLQAQKMESIGRLAGGVAHDFNNILTAIIGYSDLTLMALTPDSPLKEPLEIIGDSSRKAAALTRQLLAFSRKQVLEIKQIDVNEIVVNVSKLLHRVIGEDITLELSTRAECKVMADKTQIDQVVMNLAVNARDAMPVGGRLRIETADAEINETRDIIYDGMKAGKYVEITVSDTGVGMIPEVQEKIFEPFFTMKEEGKGTGLGLAMVYGIVKQHGGHIAVSSEPGKGSTFTIHLPAATGDVTSEKEDVVESMPRGNETVLVVDDDLSIRKLIIAALQPLGYRVLSAHDGDSALKECAGFEGKIDLLLADAVMPGISGTDFVQKFRAMRPATRIIVMSGYPGDKWNRQNSSVQMDVFIEKPVTPRHLARIVRDVLDGRDKRG